MKRALVTGASGDLGRAIARRLACDGLHVIAHANTRLAEADCFATLGLSRRDALWAARALTGDSPLPLFAGDIDGEGIVEPAVVFREMSEGEKVVEDYVSMRLTLRSHPMALLRPWLTPALAVAA